MRDLLLWLGRLGGLGGAALFLLSVVGRMMGSYWLGSFQIGTFLLAGTAAMVFACLCFLAYLVEATRGKA